MKAIQTVESKFDWGAKVFDGKCDLVIIEIAFAGYSFKYLCEYPNGERKWINEDRLDLRSRCSKNKSLLDRFF